MKLIYYSWIKKRKKKSIQKIKAFFQFHLIFSNKLINNNEEPLLIFFHVNTVITTNEVIHYLPVLSDEKKVEGKQ